MVRGYVTSFDARRGVGFIQRTVGTDRIPFTARDGEGLRFAEGDTVEYKVTGGKAGVIAYQVRRVA
jgi:cold shock CspA family protein